MQSLVLVAVAASLLAVAAPPAAAAPPPPSTGFGAAAAPWAAYVGKPKSGSALAASLQRRSPLGLGEDADTDAANSDASGFAAAPWGVAGPAAGPMSPFLKLKPVLPVKPAFGAPVVDPSKFIDMKADLLSSLFPGGLPMGMAAAPVGGPVGGAAPAGYLSARALMSPFAAPASPVMKPPPPAFLAELFKALNINKTVANVSDADSPPVFPAATPLVDPGVFISKKAKFLSDLFASLPTTPAPTPVTPDTVALNAALTASLQRVLDALAVAWPPAPAPALQDEPEDEAEQAAAAKEKRAADSSAAALGVLGDAKDKVVDTIIGELADIKNSMVGAVTDLAQAQKAADAAAAAAAPKKPLPPYAAMWAKPTATKAPTTVPVEPVHQKVVLLGQVFDMLTSMEKDIASSMVVTATGSPDSTESATTSPDILDVVKARISQIAAQSNASSAFAAPVNRTSALTSTKSLRLAGPAPKVAEGPVPVDPTFWIPDSAVVGPDAYLAKTKAFLATIMTAKSTPSPIVRRSFKPSDFQQEGNQESQTPPALQNAYSKQLEAAEQQHQAGQLRFPGFANEAQRQQHRHHHHDRQPYWWN